MSPTVSFDSNSAVGQVLRDWWESLRDDKASRAQLRRAPDLTRVVLTPGFQRLVRRLRARGFPAQLSPDQQDRLAVIAGVLAHLASADGRRLPDAMRGDDKPKVSELRFRRLLESPTLDDLFSGLRRTLPLIGAAADPAKLANDIWFWGDTVRKQWAYEYPWPGN